MNKKVFKQIVITSLSICSATTVGIMLYLLYLYNTLPNLVTVEDFKPRLVSEVFDANGEKIGEFFREKRKLVEFEDIPKKLIDAFIATEDAEFFNHSGVDKLAIIRAMIANIKAGRKIQGGSTITQQAAKSLLLTPEKTYTRKIQELFLAKRMENTLSKSDILYLYLNQIYFGSGAYGIKMAAETYFRKNLDELTTSEIALIAGLPKAPSRYSPIINPSNAKTRQLYVLGRMLAEEYISAEELQDIKNEELIVYSHNKYKDIAPYYLEAVRQYMIQVVDENKMLDEGIKIQVSMHLEKQLAAQKSLKAGLREVDKRSGYRGSLDNIADQEAGEKFLQTTREELMDKSNPIMVILADGSVKPKPPMKTPSELEYKLPDYLSIGDITKGIVVNVDDKLGLVAVKFAEAQGLIDIDTMNWAGPPDNKVRWDFRQITKPSNALKEADVIEIKIASRTFSSPRIDKMKRKSSTLPEFKNYVGLLLEQTPVMQGSLISFDLKTGDVVAMVGGYDFEKSKFNRALQALRQPGSSFKPIVYSAALDKGYTPSSIILDAPVVYKQDTTKDKAEAYANSLDMDIQGENLDAAAVTTTTAWKPKNYSSKFSGDILFRNALKRSQNIPTIKIMQNIGVSRIRDYARRLGIFSPLNMDLSMGLGSSSLTLYEMTKSFSHFANLGKKFSPVLVREISEKDEVIDSNVMVDLRFEDKIFPIDQEFEQRRLSFFEQKLEPSSDSENDNEETSDNSSVSASENINEPNIFFEDSEQLISKQVAYVTTTLLKAAVEEPGGTARRALNLERTSAGKTGTTSGYFDAWYIGYTPQIITGVWVGYDNERTIGFAETGGATALPIWVDYMKQVHQDLPKLEFQIPEDIVFASIDNETGFLASSNSKEVVKQAFIEGSEPKTRTQETEDSTDFFKQDLYD